MAELLDERSWLRLAERIRARKCTPFLGAGVREYPSAADIAEQWSATYSYPLSDHRDLARVAQFVMLQEDGMWPKDEFLRVLAAAPRPDFSEPDEPHGLLADLGLPLYITTNYDDLMVDALRQRGRNPVRLTCRWNNDIPRYNMKKQPEPTVERPWVFHLHGCDELSKSLVLTEDDYIDFLVRAGEDNLLPPQVKGAIADTSLLFMGYRLADMTFRVIFRGLVRAIPEARRYGSLAVQLPPGDESEERYLTEYFDKLQVDMFWGDARSFARELRRRLTA